MELLSLKIDAKSTRHRRCKVKLQHWRRLSATSLPRKRRWPRLALKGKMLSKPTHRSHPVGIEHSSKVLRKTRHCTCFAHVTREGTEAPLEVFASLPNVVTASGGKEKRDCMQVLRLVRQIAAHRRKRRRVATVNSRGLEWSRVARRDKMCNFVEIMRECVIDLLFLTELHTMEAPEDDGAFASREFTLPDGTLAC